MNKLFVKHVRSTLKGGVNANLAPVTLISGPNGAGKSAIINSVELAVSKRISDLAGRPPIADLDEIVTLVTPQAGTLSAYVELSNGDVCDFNADIRDDKVKSARHEVPQYLQTYDPFIVRALLADLKGMGPDTVRLWLSRQLNVDLEAIKKLLPPDVHELFDSIVASNLDVDLHELFSQIRSASLRSSRELGAAERAVDQLLSGGVVDRPEKEQALIRGELSQLRVELGRLSNVSSVRTKKDVGDEIKKIQDDQATLEIELDNIAKESTVADCARTLDALQSLITISEWIEREQRKTCLVCASTFDRAALMEQRKKVRLKITEVSRMAEKTKTVRKQIAVLQSRINNAKEAIARLNFEMERAPKTVPDNTQRISEISAQIDELEKIDAQWIRFEEQNKQVIRANTLKNKEREINQRWKLLVSAYKDALDVVFQSGLTDFVARVDAHLNPETESFYVTPQGNALGMYIKTPTGERIAPPVALEGARWTRLLLALALASRPAGPLRVAIPRDQALDVRSISHMINAGLHAWEQHGVQTLIATVIPSKIQINVQSECFTHIKLGG